MLKTALLIAAKDLRLIMIRGGAWVQSLLLGLLLIFVFSLSVPTGETAAPQTVAALFWLASAFCQVLAFSMLYTLEDITEARNGLLLAPVPVQAVWLGKLLAGLAAVLMAQVIFFPALIVFLGQTLSESALLLPAEILTVDLGMVSLGALLGAASSGHAAGESLMSVIIFPLLVPILLAGIRLGETTFDGASVGIADETVRWIGLACAYDAVFLGTSFIMFPFVFGDKQ